MIICPDCYHEVANSADQCSECDWKLEHIEGFKNFLSTQDRQSSMFKKYFENYETIANDDLTQSIQNVNYIHNQTTKFDRYVGDIKGLKVCEVGVGQGNLFKRLADKNPEKLVGIDISVPYFKVISQACPSGEFVIANAENIPYKNEFDLIIASDILEHVFNVGDFLISVNRALKDNGKFVVRTPYDEDINNYSRFKGCPYDYVHLRNFSKKTLKTVLTGAGFKVEKIHFDGFYPHLKRKFITKNEHINRKFDEYIEKNYETVHDVSAINNFLGCLLMKPIEITAVTRKTEEIPLI